MCLRLRVRQCLDDSECRAALRGKLPPEAQHAPPLPRVSYPQSLVKLLSHDNRYADFGLLTEALLRRPAVTREALEEVLADFTPQRLSPKAAVVAYLDNAKAAHARMRDAARGAPLGYDAVLTGEHVEGHPDARTATDVFEVKTTGKLTEGWTYFVLQLFCYAALGASFERAHLALPLQGAVFSFDVTEAHWPKRALFRQTLESYAERVAQQALIAATPRSEMALNLAFALFPVGHHISKQGDLVSTLGWAAQMPNLPYQIFLGGNQTSTTLRVTDAELAEGQQLVSNQHLTVFVHAAYLFNLCNLNEYNVPCLTSLLRKSAAIGARGVVVHVGKACSLPVAEALENMTANLLELAEAASPDCPLLLETPSGQGTEVLTAGPEELCAFCAGFEDPRLGLCVDTCHVFATGHAPSAYLDKVIGNPGWRPLLKLVHFNDSSKTFGSRVDRHAPLGTGEIGGEELRQAASLAAGAGVPLVNE